MEIAFFTSFAAILAFLIYKVVSVKRQVLEQKRHRWYGKYDPIDHVFSAGAYVFDTTVLVSKKTYRGLSHMFMHVRDSRRIADDEDRQEKSQTRGAASFYLKKMSEHKKAIRRQQKQSLEKK